MNARQLSTCALAALSLAASSGAQSWETCGGIHSLTGEAGGDQFGFIVRNAGDADQDGVDDIVVGAVTHGTGGAASGRGYLYSGASGALLFQVSGSPSENLGYVANGAGDVNGDGSADVIFGAPDLSNGTPGAAYVHSGMDGTLLYAMQGESNGDRFGQTANGVGDVNMDGHADFAVGAELHSSLGPARGRVYVYSGSDGSILYQFDGEQDGDQLGSGLATLGDRDGDGHDDFILGAPQGTGGRGKAYVHDGATGQRLCTLLPPSTGATFGLYMLGYAGDLNADGTPDFFVGDFSDNQSRGRVRVYDGVDCSVMYELTGDSPGDVFGTGSGFAGDIDGDGVDDLVFGALGDGTQGRGRLHLFSGPTGETIGVLNGEIAGDGFGFSAAGAGDLDGDGAPDYLVGVPANSNGQGAVFALSGRPFPPANTCSALPNSTGGAAELSVRRSLSLASNTMRLRVVGGIADEPAIYVFGRNGATVPLADGTLCVSGDLTRIAVVSLNTLGNHTLDLDLTAEPFGSGLSQVFAGDTRHFQCWYRDPAAAIGANLSNGVVLTFCP